MLILARKVNERIFIDEDIVLVVLAVENNRVKLGIEAPAEVTILREEIRDGASKSKVDNKKASNDAEVVGPLKTGT